MPSFSRFSGGDSCRLAPSCSAARSCRPSLSAAARRRNCTRVDARPKGWTGTFAPAPSRNVDMLFVIDDSSDMALAQDNLIRNFPTFMTTLQSATQRFPEHPRRRRLVGHGRGRHRRLRPRDGLGRQAGDLPVHASRHVHRDGPRGGRDVHFEHRRPGNYTGMLRVCSAASRPSASPAAGSITSSPPSCARSAPTVTRRRRRIRASCGPRPRSRS